MIARRLRGPALLVAVALVAAGGFGATCDEPADLVAGGALAGSLVPTDLDQNGIWTAHRIDVGALEVSLTTTKGGPRLLVDPARRYDVLSLRLRPDERVLLRVSSVDFDPVVAVTDDAGQVLGANDDADATTPSTDAWLAVQNALNAPADFLVVVTEFGGPLGGSYRIEVNPD